MVIDQQILQELAKLGQHAIGMQQQLQTIEAKMDSQACDLGELTTKVALLEREVERINSHEHGFQNRLHKLEGVRAGLGGMVTMLVFVGQFLLFVLQTYMAYKTLK